MTCQPLLCFCLSHCTALERGAGRRSRLCSSFSSHLTSPSGKNAPPCCVPGVRAYETPAVPSMGCWEGSVNEGGSSWLTWFSFSRCPSDAEWEGGEGMCLIFNYAELSWQALLQGYRKTRLQNLEICSCTFLPAAWGKRWFSTSYQQNCSNGALSCWHQGYPGRPVLCSSCWAASAPTPAFPL